MSEKSKSTTFLLCYFLGLLGVHRFYLNKVLTGVLMLLTLGGLGIWWLVDSVLIAAGQMKDKAGNPLRTGPPDADNPHAGFWVRAAALSVDGLILNLILSVVFTGLTMVLPVLGLGAIGAMGGDLQALGGDLAAGGGPDPVIMTMMLTLGVTGLSLLALPVYFGIQHASRHQATIGKRCFDIYVVGPDGGRPGLGRSVWRAFGYLISSLPLYLGFVMAGFTREKRALHDYLAGTRVLHVGQVAQPAEALPEPVEPATPMSDDDLPLPDPGSGAATVAAGRSGTGLMVLGVALLAGAAALAMMS